MASSQSGSSSSICVPASRVENQSSPCSTTSGTRSGQRDASATVNGTSNRHIPLGFFSQSPSSARQTVDHGSSETSSCANDGLQEDAEISLHGLDLADPLPLQEARERGDRQDALELVLATGAPRIEVGGTNPLRGLVAANVRDPATC